LTVRVCAMFCPPPGRRRSPLSPMVSSWGGHDPYLLYSVSSGFFKFQPELVAWLEFVLCATPSGAGCAVLLIGRTYDMIKFFFVHPQLFHHFIRNCLSMSFLVDSPPNGGRPLAFSSSYYTVKDQYLEDRINCVLPRRHWTFFSLRVPFTPGGTRSRDPGKSYFCKV